MDSLNQARDFSHYVESLPSNEQSSHIDVLYERWRANALADEEFAEIEASLSDFRTGERGEEHSQTMTRLRRELENETSLEQ